MLSGLVNSANDRNTGKPAGAFAKFNKPFLLLLVFHYFLKLKTMISKARDKISPQEMKMWQESRESAFWIHLFKEWGY